MLAVDQVETYETLIRLHEENRRLREFCRRIVEADDEDFEEHTIMSIEAIATEIRKFLAETIALNDFVYNPIPTGASDIPSNLLWTAKDV